MRLIAITLIAAFASLPAQSLMAQNGETPPAAETAKNGEGDQRVVCRRVDVTGSLIKRGRVCRTVAQWRQITENGNYNARKMVEEGTTKGGGQ